VQLEFDTLLDVCAKLNAAKPVEEILDELLLQARSLVRAEAGTVFIVLENRLSFVCCQNDVRPDLCVTPSLADRLKIGLKGITLPINDKSLAGYSANNGVALNIQDAYNLPTDKPYRFEASYDESSGYRTKSLLVIPLIDQTERAVGVLQLINRAGDSGIAFSDRDQQIAMALASMAAISIRNAKLREEIRDSHLDTIMRLSAAAEMRDDDTGQHIRRVSMYCETVAREMGHPHEFTQLMLFASPMHDIGKLGVPDAILKKAGKLTADERLTMERHTTFGAEILDGSRIELMQVAKRIAEAHHERWDGAGYPHKIAREDIPIEGRICAVADVFDALTSARVYKAAFTMDKAYGIIEEEAGSHFDPNVVDAMVRIRPEIEAIQELFGDEAGKGPTPGIPASIAEA
jgi:HD-GYP domain-containing protein (c-di-GMP phosphodiesterase class II)